MLAARERQEVRYVLQSGARYFPKTTHAVLLDLPIKTTSLHFSDDLTLVYLPDWASEIGVGSPPYLLVPTFCVQDGPGEDWQNCDWWTALFSMLTGEAERAIEAKNGPIHSYSYRLPHKYSQLYDHAWVNRAMLFLRRWAAHHEKRPETDIFGALPKPEIMLTHDVDALAKTFPIRLKQAAFQAINSVRLSANGRLGEAATQIKNGTAFFFRPANYFYLEHITKLEQKYTQSSTFNVYAGYGSKRRTLKKYIMDPGYDISEQRYALAFNKLVDRGFTVGLHQSFDAWRDGELMGEEKDRIEKAIGSPVNDCRQHWLRFSWQETWAAQETSGLTLDTTLGFNDRPGFRNSAALRMPAWLAADNRPSDRLDMVPLILMDSHLFDYNILSAVERSKTIDRWLNEVYAVGGQASIVWHQRVFHPKDYGWGDDYEYILSRLSAW